MKIGKGRGLIAAALWLVALATASPGQAQEVPPVDLDKTASDAASLLPTPAGSTDGECSTDCGGKKCSASGSKCVCKCSWTWECECSGEGFLDLFTLN